MILVTSLRNICFGSECEFVSALQHLQPVASCSVDSMQLIWWSARRFWEPGSHWTLQASFDWSDMLSLLFLEWFAKANDCWDHYTGGLEFCFQRCGCLREWSENISQFLKNLNIFRRDDNWRWPNCTNLLQYSFTFNLCINNSIKHRKCTGWE